MLPGWNTQMLIDRERELRKAAERRRTRGPQQAGRAEATADVRPLVSTPCAEACLERPMARAG